MNKKQKQNAFTLLKTMERSQITSPAIKIRILCVIMKESGMIPRVESSYANTSNDRIRKTFGKKKLGGFFVADNDLNQLKNHPKNFFSVVYRDVAGNRGRLTDDGYNYRGRGYCQHTGIGNYKWLQKHTGYALVSRPGMLRYSDCAAKCAVAFYESQIKRHNKKIDNLIISQYNTTDVPASDTALLIVANITAGIGKRPNSKTVQRAYNSAMTHLSAMTSLYDEYIEQGCGF